MADVAHESVAQYGAELRPMTVPEFTRAWEHGVFRKDEKLELLRGEVVRMSPQSSRHAAVTTILREGLGAIYVDTCIRDHSPLALDAHNEPEPDVLVAVGPCSRYLDRHPGPDDVLLVVEVADTSLKKDRTLKAALYAEFGLPEFWLVDLAAGVVEVRREPQAAGYAETERVVEDSVLAAVELALGRQSLT